jgi:two-component system LytT family response regulator
VNIRALVIDDERLARRTILRFLAKHGEVEVIGECEDGECSVDAIRSKKPDLVFLDVQMPEMDGFQVVSTVGADKMPVTIFVTAYDTYALRAFEANAVDYLLKPVSKERFERALVRAKQRMANIDQTQLQRLFSSLHHLSTQQQRPERLAIPKGERIVLIPVKDIQWIEAKGNYVRLHVGAGDFEFRRTLTELEAQLDPAVFLRIHRSAIVNIEKIKEIQTWFHGYHRVLLVSGKELRMSRYQHEIARKLGLT